VLVLFGASGISHCCCTAQGEWLRPMQMWTVLQ